PPEFRGCTMRSERMLVAAVLVIVAVCGSVGGSAAEDKPWPVEGARVLQAKDGGKSKDISGIACTGATFPRTCLVIDDDMQAAQSVLVNDGSLEAGKLIPLIENRFKGEALELDGEGVAYWDGAFYVMGSHGYPRDKKGVLDPIKDAKEI